MSAAQEIFSRPHISEPQSSVRDAVVMFGISLVKLLGLNEVWVDLTTEKPVHEMVWNENCSLFKGPFPEDVAKHLHGEVVLWSDD